MIDLLTATQDAVYAALNVSPVTNIAPVYQHVPDNRQPPIVIIDDITSEADGSKDGSLDRITINIITVRREPRRAALYELMGAVRTALDGVAITATGALLTPPVFESSEDTLADDGVTYIGTQRFALWAQPS